MKLKNYQEDLVLYIAEIVIQDRPDVTSSEEFLHDVAAFTLNRLPPRYILSERGFTRLASEHFLNGDNGNGDGKGLTDMVQLLFIVNTAIDTIKDRRHFELGDESDDVATAAEEAADVMSNWHNIPYLVGRVADAKTHEPLSDVEVTLYINNELAHPAEAGWSNPYKTSGATKGLFSFRPKPVRNKSAEQDFSLKITLQHPKYEPTELLKPVHTTGELITEDFINSDRILSLDTVFMTGSSGS